MSFCTLFSSKACISQIHGRFITEHKDKLDKKADSRIKNLVERKFKRVIKDETKGFVNSSL
jgi:hypothetical protein